MPALSAASAPRPHRAAVPLPLAEVGAKFLFQVIAERAEKAAAIVTTNLPLSEWTQVIPNARLCKALLDRITDRANIRMSEFALGFAGAEAALTEASGHAIDLGDSKYGLLRSRGDTIEEGTSEIQEGMIAERAKAAEKLFSFYS